jgi:excisionase family DNA binding protein
MTLESGLRMRERYLTTAEVMELLQLRRNTVCDWVKSGELPATRTRSGYRFDPGVLADWIRARSTRVQREGA